MKTAYIIETNKTYFNKSKVCDFVHTSYFKSAGRYLPCIEFTTKIKEASRYKTKKKAQETIDFLGLEKENQKCAIIKIEV